MIDLQTLGLSSVIASTISALFFVLIWLLNRDIPAVNVWFCSMILQPLGWVLITLRGHITEWVSIFCGNILIFNSILLYLVGAQVFFNLSERNKPTIIVFYLLFLPLFTYYTFVEPDIFARIIIVFTLSGAMMLQCVLIPFSLPRAKRTIGSYTFSLIAIVILLLILIRLVGTIWSSSVDSLFSFSLTNLVGVLVGFVMCYGMGLTLIVLCNERRIIDIEKLKESAKLDAQLKNNYLAILSHEIRTPLNGMIGTAQLMKTKAIAKEIQHDCNVIIDAGKALSELSLEVLNYSSATVLQQIPSNKQWLNISAWLNGIVKLLRPLAESKALTLKLETDRNLPQHIELDSNKVRQVLINLVGNAIKYTNTGEVTLSVSYKAQSYDHGNLTLKVIDTGIGICEDEQAQLFKPFTQGSNRTPESADSINEGVGLGLSITQKILKTLNSQLTVASELGKGSSFAFTLTVNCGDKAHLLADINTVITTGLNILVVEDLLINQNVVLSMLGIDNHQVDLAVTAQQALEKLSTQAYDVILLDMQLPDLHGLAIYEALRNNSKHLNHRTEIIGLTATITPLDRKKYQQTDLVEIVEKPIIIDRLRTAITKSQNRGNNSGKSRLIESPSTISVQSIKPLDEYLLFDPKPLNFLKENLDANDLAEEIQKLPQQLHDFNNIITKANQQKAFELMGKSLHKLAGYAAQMGLTRLSKHAAALEVNVEKNQEVHLNVLLHLTEKSIDAINTANAFQHLKY